jgi:hypothetical protein
MRVVDTFAKKGYKVTIFQTESRYLLQAEDENYMLSWKLDKEIPLDHIKNKAIDILLENAERLWPELHKDLTLSLGKTSSAEDFPDII